GPRGERVIVVSEKSAFPALAATVADTPVAVWRDYLRLRRLHTLADYLPQRVSDTDFDFYGKVLSGQKQQLKRDLRALEVLDGSMGEALGKLYCEKYFPLESKRKLQVLVDNLLKAYAADIQSLPWMSTTTRAKALEKIKTFYPKVGYPDTWRDY